jgi:DUF1680 family protein
MKHRLLRILETAALIACLAVLVLSAARSDDSIRPASVLDVKFADSLWAARQETNRRTSIPYVLGELKRRGSVSGFAVLAGRTEERYRGYMWADSDVYKTLEGIAYSLRTNPDASLEKEAEQIIGLIVRAQAADGYLMPHLQIAEPNYTHYADETTRTCESYSQGHLIESAVAQYEAEGRREYLDAAVKTADLLARVHAEGKLEQILWSHRLFLATGDARYLDVAERAFFNGLLAGVSLGGDKFFYVNPLASRGNHHRQPWHGCTCCPTNIVRFFPTLGQYVYASTESTVYVNLYAAGSGDRWSIASKGSTTAGALRTWCCRPRRPWPPNTGPTCSAA